MPRPKGAVDPQKTLEIVIQVVVLLFAVSFHESAHGFVAMKCGDNTARDLGRITMNPLKHLDPIGSLLFPAMLAFSGLPVFGWAKPVPVSLRGVRNPRRANLLVSAAGPLSNLLLAVVFAGVVFALQGAFDSSKREPCFFAAAPHRRPLGARERFAGDLQPAPDPAPGRLRRRREPRSAPRAFRRSCGCAASASSSSCVMMFTGVLGFIMRPARRDLVVGWLTS